MVNQDRSFHGRLRLWKEGWWKDWTSQIVIGVNDFTTGGTFEYSDMSVEGDGNGYHNRYYIAATKHLSWHGEWGIHAAYVYSKRIGHKFNGPGIGVDYQFALPEVSTLNKVVNGLCSSHWAFHFFCPNKRNETKKIRRLHFFTYSGGFLR